MLSGVDLSIEDDGTETYNICLFTLDGVTYKAIEDPSDGYRSYCKDLEISDKKPFYTFPAVKVFCCMKDNDRYQNNNVLVMKDFLNGKSILEVGTENFDDYYPYCHFQYSPENMTINQALNKTNKER